MIPSLQEVLEMMVEENKKRQIYLFLDMKDDDMWDDLLKLLNGKHYSFVVIKSYSLPILYHIHHINKFIKSAYIVDIQNFNNFQSNVKNLDGVDIISINYTLLSRRIFQIVKKYNKEIFVWTINDKNLLSDKDKLQINYLCTDYPKYFL